MLVKNELNNFYSVRNRIPLLFNPCVDVISETFKLHAHDTRTRRAQWCFRGDLSYSTISADYFKYGDIKGTYYVDIDWLLG